MEHKIKLLQNFFSVLFGTSFIFGTSIISDFTKLFMVTIQLRDRWYIESRIVKDLPIAYISYLHNKSIIEKVLL